METKWSSSSNLIMCLPKKTSQAWRVSLSREGNSETAYKPQRRSKQWRRIREGFSQTVHTGRLPILFFNQQFCFSQRLTNDHMTEENLLTTVAFHSMKVQQEATGWHVKDRPGAAVKHKLGHSCFPSWTTRSDPLSPFKTVLGWVIWSVKADREHSAGSLISGAEWCWGVVGFLYSVWI